MTDLTDSRFDLRGTKSRKEAEGLANHHLQQPEDDFAAGLLRRMGYDEFVTTRSDLAAVMLESALILRDLAASEPIVLLNDGAGNEVCGLCNEDVWVPEDGKYRRTNRVVHLPTCPWLRATKLTGGA